MSPKHGNNHRPAARPSVANMQHASGDGGSSESTLMSRRRFLYGAVGVGAVAAIGIGAAAYSSQSDTSDSSVTGLDVPKRSLTTLNDFEALESTEGIIEQVGEYDLPYGTLVWANDEEVAACLLPTESGSPLAQVGLLFLGSGTCDTVVKKAVGATDGFEIYDARANGKGLIWTEANILQGTWRIYATTISSGAIGEPLMLEEGDGTYETPTLAVSGSRAFWLVNPKSTEADAPSARLMGATFGKNDAAIVLESSRRMGTPPYAFNGTITVSPRIDSPSLYYQLTNIDIGTEEVRDTVTLPHAIAPIEAGYGDTGFFFSFPDIYDYDSAISNLGTYTPREKPSDGNYDNASWFNFTRTPSAPPAWCNGLFLVKSTYAVCGVNLKDGTYFTIDVEDGADSYGEYLASTDSNSTFVTYTNIDHIPVGAASIHTCRVKVWKVI